MELSVKQQTDQIVPSVPSVDGYVGEIDALRCLAMTGVVAQHCGLMPFGWTGVWLFYVISGFAITSSLLVSQKLQYPKLFLIRNFYLRRCIRIWPLYFLFVLGNMVVAVLVGRSDVLDSVPWLATFTYNFRMMLHDDQWSTIGHLWTISVEEQFYLIYPFLFVFLSRRWLVVALWGCIVLTPVGRAVITLWFDSVSHDDLWKAFSLYAFSPAQFDAFSAGALLALFRPFLTSRPQFARKTAVIALGAGLVYACAYIGLNVAHHELGKDTFRNIFSGILWGQGRQIWLYSVIGGLSASIIALILSGEPRLRAVCRIPLLQPIGRISFGAYVYHAAVLGLYQMLWPPVGTVYSTTYSLGKFAVAYPITILIAFLSFRYFEQPILKFRHRLK
jgi:peptidoglycan/LPS O-acetylase OafA/YrhL